MKYSLFSLVRNGLSHHEKWLRAWRHPEPRRKYEVIVVGGGGHGLATACMLCRVARSAAIGEAAPPTSQSWRGRLQQHLSAT